MLLLCGVCDGNAILLQKVDLQWETTKLCNYNVVSAEHSDTL